MSFTRAQILGQARKSVVIFDKDDGMTEQSHRDSCDIHTIMRKYERTGLIDHVNANPGEYLDAPSGLDFKTAQDIIAEAKSIFEEVPSKIRAKFGNDPAKFLDYVQNPENRDSMVELGLDTSHFPPVVADPAPADPAPADPPA